MKKCSIFGKVALVASSAFLAVCLSVQAADMAAALEKLADISAKVAATKAELAEAASKGDVATAGKIAKKSQELDGALADANEALKALQNALEGGNERAAEVAMERIARAEEQVNKVKVEKPELPGDDTPGDKPKDDPKPSPEPKGQPKVLPNLDLGHVPVVDTNATET